MINNTLDFWTAYENLCKSLMEADKKIIADSLKKAQMYVNGMTDGWFDFMDAFEKTIQANQASLNIEEKNTAHALLGELKKSFTNN